MEHIRSIEELTEARQEALHRRMSRTRQHPFQLRISLGSCGIAAGADETLKAIHQFIREKNLEDVQIEQIGCIGLCALEPIVQVVDPGGQQVTYGKVSPAIVKRIFNEHIEKRIILQEYVVDNI
jgi:NADP-reducing hydrogenase subunit HndB